ncbi:hypothetical protein KAX14_01195, partial [Candidatus Bipolaricaulota bacterium]|nr:hypothetical protein [Candidatus Bipolaricaulota bacterium]
GVLAGFLKKRISRFAESVIHKSLGVIEREHPLSHVKLSLGEKKMIVRLGKVRFSLEDVDRQSAEVFLRKLDEIKNKIEK